MSGRLLLVSKDPLALAGISNAVRLRLPEVAIETASSAERALMLLAATDVDIIVFPVPMPDMDALAFLKEAKALRPESLAFVVGHPGDHDLRHTAMRNGADGFIEQPIIIDRFIPILCQAIADRHSLLA
jgi:DNA-binding NarL/FixJ family response regulator